MACRVAFEVDKGRTVRDDVLHVLHIRNIKARVGSLAEDSFATVNHPLLSVVADAPTASLFLVVHDAALPGPSLAAKPWLSDDWDWASAGDAKARTTPRATPSNTLFLLMKPTEIRDRNRCADRVPPSRRSRSSRDLLRSDGTRRRWPARRGRGRRTSFGRDSATAAD